MGLPTMLLTPMTSEQIDAYTIHLRVEEITQKLKIGDIVPRDGNRCVVSSTSDNLYFNFLTLFSADHALQRLRTITKAVV